MISLLTFTDRLKFVFSILRRYKIQITFFILLEIVFAGLSAAIPYFTKLQIDQLQLNLNDAKTAFWWFGVALIVPVIIEFFQSFVLARLRQKFSLKFETGVRVSVEKYIWNKLETLDNGFFENLRNRRLLSWILGSSGSVNDFFRFFLARVNDGTLLLSILPILALVQWQVMVAVIVGSIVQLGITELVRNQKMISSMVEERQNERLWEVQDALSKSFQTLRSLGASQYFLKELDALYHERDVYILERDIQSDYLVRLQWFANTCVTLGVHIFAGWQVLNGNITLGSFTLVVSYTGRLSSVFNNLVESVTTWQEIQLDFDQMNFFFMLRSRIRIGEHTEEKIENPQVLKLQDVHFTYPDLLAEERSYVQMMIAKAERFMKTHWASYFRREIQDWQHMLEVGKDSLPVLKGVDMEVKKGKIVALLGRNGAGKTTITQLLMHQHEPTQGEVLLDGLSVFKYPQQLLLEQFAVIQQKPFILERFTVRENLLLGIARKISEEEIWEVLEKVDLKKRIETLPKGLDTVLGEEVSLSGGQEQLLAVSRVFLQKRPFVLFDEGMNQMDIEHEMKVMDLLQEQRQHSAILFITHRITTARKADYIYMLDEGKIAEEGTHSKLIALGGLYATFWKMQVIE